MPFALGAFIVPLIVACAMFMENVDGTVIVTSLPVLARDLGQDPITLKLAVTAYVIGLGVFIPICGWVADRFGSRTVFRTAIGIFMAGSLMCAASTSLGTVHGRALRARHRRRDDGAGRAHHHLPFGAEIRLHPRDQLSDACPRCSGLWSGRRSAASSPPICIGA